MQSDRTANYSIAYANGFSVSMSDHDFKINFGTTDGTSPDTVTESIGVFMTHRTLKLLAKTLNILVENYESTTGKLIEFDEAKLSIFESGE